MPPCEYGTRKQTGAPSAVYMTQSLVSMWLESEQDWLAPLLWLIGDELINVDTLCATVPNTVPAFTIDDLINKDLGAELLKEAYKASLWSGYCECVPAPAGGSTECSTTCPGLVFVSQPTCTLVDTGSGSEYREEVNDGVDYQVFCQGACRGHVNGRFVTYTYPVSMGGTNTDNIYNAVLFSDSSRTVAVYSQPATSSGASWLGFFFCPQSQPAPTDPAGVGPPVRPDGAPDVPPIDDCSVEDVCTRVQYLLHDVQHLFTQISAARSAVLADTTTLIGDTTQLLSDVGVVKGDTTALVPAVAAIQVDTTAILSQVADLELGITRLIAPAHTLGFASAIADVVQFGLPDDCLGVVIHLDIIPAWVDRFRGDPVRATLGNVAFGDANGYDSPVNITFADYTHWLPRRGYTDVSVSLTPGVSGTLTPIVEVV